MLNTVIVIRSFSSIESIRRTEINLYPWPAAGICQSGAPPRIMRRNGAFSITNIQIIDEMLFLQDVKANFYLT